MKTTNLESQCTTRDLWVRATTAVEAEYWAWDPAQDRATLTPAAQQDTCKT